MSLIGTRIPDWGSKNWEIASADIRCKADAAGANVFVFDYYVSGIGSWLSVLAHDKETARLTALDYIQEKRKAEDME